MIIDIALGIILAVVILGALAFLLIMFVNRPEGWFEIVYALPFLLVRWLIKNLWVVVRRAVKAVRNVLLEKI